MTAAEALGPHLRAFLILEVAKTACGQEVHLSAGCEEERHQLTGVHVAMVQGEGMGVVLRDCLARYQEQAMTMTYYPWSPPALEKGNRPQGGYQAAAERKPCIPEWQGLAWALGRVMEPKMMVRVHEGGSQESQHQRGAQGSGPETTLTGEVKLVCEGWKAVSLDDGSAVHL